MPYDPTSEADIRAAIEMAQRMNAAEPDMRGMIQSVYLPPKPQEPYQFGDLMGEMTAPGRRDISQASQTQQAVQSQYPQGTVIPQMSEADRAKMREAAWQKLSGFGSTVYNAATAAIPEILPSFIVGEPYQRKQLARDIGAMPDAFAGMGSAIVGPSFERAANMTRRGILGADAGDAAKVGVQAAREILNTSPVESPLAAADMAPTLARGERIETAVPKPAFGDAEDFADDFLPPIQQNPYALPEQPILRSERDPSALSPESNPLADMPNLKLPQIEQPSAFLTLGPRDMKIVRKFGKKGDDQNLVAETIKRIRENYSPEKGFEDFQIVGGKFDKTKSGERIFVPKFKEQNYDFNTPPTKMSKQQWEGQIANSVVNEVDNVVQRAQQGDQAAINILKEARWYRAMRERMRLEFGGLGDLFADLLGTTSAQTGVTQNWNNAIEILRRFSRGEYDREIAAYEKLLATGGDTNPVKLQQLFKKGQFPLITKASGQLFNANSPASTRALLGLFREVRAGLSPKTPNFTGNLIGYSNRATIDVWAARMLRRLAGKKPIPPAAEKAVRGKHTAKSTMFDPKISGEFGFGQNVFQQAANTINNRGIIKNFDPSLGNLGADDLQAVAWFIEKERWTNKGWTSKAGEGGSLDFEANLAGAADPERIRQLRKIASSNFVPPKKLKTEGDDEYAARLIALRDQFNINKAEAQTELDQAAAPLTRYTLGISRERPNQIPTNLEQLELATPLIDVVKNDPSVIALQANNTIGRYAQKSERALNAEYVVTSAFDPGNLMRSLVEAGKKYNQDSVFMSKVLRSAADSPNARPGIEIYFRERMPEEFVQQLSDELVAKGIDGFTYITDARQADRVQVQANMPDQRTAGLTGIRFQYIPEFGDPIDPSMWGQVMGQKALDYDKITRDLVAKYPQISTAEPTWYDTEVVFNGGYDDYLARTAKASGGGVRYGRPIYANASGQARQPTIFGGRSGDVYHRVSGAEQEADIEAALNTARQHFGDGGTANRLPANLDPLGYMPVSARPPEDRNVPVVISTAKGPYKTTQQELDRGSRRSEYLYGKYVDPVVQAFTLPGRAMRGEVDVYNNDQMIPEIVNFAGLVTGGAGVVPAEANALRIGFSGARAKTADVAAIKRADDMFAQGASPREIWQETGYFPSPRTEKNSVLLGKPMAKMVRYEQPQGLAVDVAKLQNAPTYDYQYKLPDVFTEKSFEAAYPDLYQNTPVIARFRDGKQPAAGAGFMPGKVNLVTGKQETPPTILIGNVSAPGFQTTKGEIGSMGHEINHMIEAHEGLPLAVPPKSGPHTVIEAINNILIDPQTSAADKAYYTNIGKDFIKEVQKNPGNVSAGLYFHNSSEAMSRIAEKMAAHPELRPEFPLDLLDVRPDWLISNRRPFSGPISIKEDPAIALEIAKWSNSPEGRAAMDAVGQGQSFSYSRQFPDLISSALMIAKGQKP